MLIYLPVLGRCTATCPHHEEASTSRAEDRVSDVKPGNRDDNSEDAEGHYKGGIGGIVRIRHGIDGFNRIADPKYVLMQWPRIEPNEICLTFTLRGCALYFMSLCEPKIFGVGRQLTIWYGYRICEDDSSSPD